MEVLVLPGKVVKHYSGKRPAKSAFTKQEIREIAHLLHSGESYLHVAKKFKTTSKAIVEVEKYYFDTKATNNNVYFVDVVLGHKDGPYYDTEEGMLKDLDYSVKELSKEELKIYKNTNRHDTSRKN